MATTIEQIFEDIKALPPVKMQKVFEFVESIKQKDTKQTQSKKVAQNTQTTSKNKVTDLSHLHPDILSMMGCIKLPPEQAESLNAKEERHKYLDEKYGL